MVLLSLLLALNIFHNFYWAFIVDSEKIIVCWSLTLFMKLKTKCEKDTHIFPNYLNTKKRLYCMRISRTLQHLKKSSATSRSAAASKMEPALILRNNFESLTVVTMNSILKNKGVLDTSLHYFFVYHPSPFSLHLEEKSLCPAQLYKDLGIYNVQWYIGYKVVSAASRCILVPFERYGCPKSSCNLFSICISCKD